MVSAAVVWGMGVMLMSYEARHSTVAYVFICIQLAPLAMRSYVCISLV